VGVEHKFVWLIARSQFMREEQQLSVQEFSMDQGRRVDEGFRVGDDNDELVAETIRRLTTIFLRCNDDY
jgi:hypothetical protein